MRGVLWRIRPDIAVSKPEDSRRNFPSADRGSLKFFEDLRDFFSKFKVESFHPFIIHTTPILSTKTKAASTRTSRPCMRGAMFNASLHVNPPNHIPSKHQLNSFILNTQRLKHQSSDLNETNTT